MKISLYIVLSLILISQLRGELAYSPDDNSFHVEESPRDKRVALPAKVSESLGHLLISVEADFDASEEPDHKTHLEWRTTKLTSPNGTEVYVAKIFGLSGFIGYYFLSFNPTIGVCSSEKLMIFGKWMDGEPPKDLPLPNALSKFGTVDSREVIIVTEQVHNGTVYNGIVTHYYDLSTAGSIHQLVAVESYVYDWFGQPLICERRLEKSPKGDWVIRTFSKSDKPNSVTKYVGEVSLTLPGPTGSFVILDEHHEPGFEKFPLVSHVCEGRPMENKFLNAGYTEYY